MGKKLTLFMIEGSAVGPICIDVGNWSGRAIYCPRSRAVDILNRPDFNKPGIYILKSDNTKKDTSSEKIYIGEAEVLRKRIKDHLSDTNKEFFSEFIAFISKDELLTKAHVKFLESKLIKAALDVNTAEIENKNKPDANFLGEAEISDMDYFYSQIELILPTVNFRFLVPSTLQVDNNKEENEPEVLYSLKSKDYKGEMFEGKSGFVVKKGATASVKIQKSLSKGWFKIRESLKERQILVLDKNKDKYILKQDAIFTSPSAAASALLGRQTAGPLFWEDKNGKLLKENLAEELKNEE